MPNALVKPADQICGNRRLQLGQIVQDFRLTPVDGADKFAAQNALAIDDVGLGEFEGSVKVVALLVGIAHGEQVDVVGLSEKLW